eukprot:3064857-Amphidinium_carterae.2
MNNSIRSVGGACASNIAHGLHMNGLLDAGHETSLTRIGHEHISNHVVAAYDKGPRARLGMLAIGVKQVATGVHACALAMLAWRVCPRGRKAKPDSKAISDHSIGQGGGWGGRPGGEPAAWKGLSNVAHDSIVLL